MNIEECIEQLKDLRLYCLSIGYEFDKDAEAIEWILTAYEKEKEEHKKECHNCDEYTAKLGKLEVENEMLKLELEKEKEKNKKAIDFINNENNYFEDGENWQNVLKIKEILEE